MRLWRGIIGILLMMGVSLAFAVAESQQFANSIWSPYYHGKRLSYCLSNDAICGQPVADRYCRMLGYEGAQIATIDNNLGLTSYLDKDKCCRGWECNGFKLIRCTAETRHHPKREYYYRFKKFVLPRYNHYRIDWCYQKGKQCGKRAAFSFCRRMGYEKEMAFHPEPHLAATRSLGDQRLCFGGDCKGFSSITCYR